MEFEIVVAIALKEALGLSSPHSLFPSHQNERGSAPPRAPCPDTLWYAQKYQGQVYGLKLPKL